MKKIITLIVAVVATRLYLQSTQGRKLMRKANNVRYGVQYKIAEYVQSKVEKVTAKIESAATSVNDKMEKFADIS